MLAAAGYEDVNLCLVYYSGCSLKMHYEWWQSDEANYRFCVWNKDGYQAIEGYSLKKALDFLPWDVIVFSGNSKAYESLDAETSVLQNARIWSGFLAAMPGRRYGIFRCLRHL